MNNNNEETTAGSSSVSGSGVLTILWRRKALIVFGLLVGLVGGFLYYMQKPPTFQSQGQIVVLKRRADVSAGMNQSGYLEDYVEPQEALIQSYEVINKVAKRLENTTLRMPPVTGDYYSFVKMGLKVSRNKDAATGTSSNVLNIAFSGPSPDDCAVVVKAVIEGYRDSITGVVTSETDHTLKQITSGQQKEEENLAKAQKDYTAVHEEIRRSSNLEATALKARINNGEQKRIELLNAKVEFESQLRLIQNGIAQGQPREVLERLLGLYTPGRREILPDQPRTAEELTFSLKLAKAEKSLTLGPDHPDMQMLQKRQDLIEEYVRKIDKDRPAPEKTNEIDLYVKVVMQKVEANRLQTDYITTQLNEDRVAVGKLDEQLIREKLITDQIDRIRKRLDNFTERKQNYDLFKDSQPFDAREITPASMGTIVSPILPTTLALAGVFGLLLGCGLAYLAEVSDKSFRTIDEVRQRLNATVIGQVPPLTPHEPSVLEQNPLDPLLVVHHAPKSVQSEAYRGVRTSLYFSTRGKGHQVIQVTSPNPGDGKSTLVANLAASIAQSGKRVVLIDCDFRKPRVHKIFGLGKAEVGLASVIAGEAELESAIYSCEVPGLSIVPCGPRPANPADLLTSGLFQEILDEIKKDYDFVLIDTPPMLAVSDPSVVAPRVDGVILTIRMVKNNRPPAEQAKERLSVLGANLLGVVVNGMDDSRGSYGYGYGYGYNYEYAYGDDYQDSGVNLNKPR